jgi:hypothetical protein
LDFFLNPPEWSLDRSEQPSGPEALKLSGGHLELTREGLGRLGDRPHRGQIDAAVVIVEPVVVKGRCLFRAFGRHPSCNTRRACQEASMLRHDRHHPGTEGPPPSGCRTTPIQFLGRRPKKSGGLTSRPAGEVIDGHPGAMLTLRNLATRQQRPDGKR